jgi:hypothetical protein
MESSDMVYCIEKDGNVYCNEYKINSLLLKRGKPIMTSLEDYIIPRGLYSENHLKYESDSDSDTDIHYSGVIDEPELNNKVIKDDLYDVLLKLASEPVKKSSKKRKIKLNKKTRKN